jgi:hypothetical protein
MRLIAAFAVDVVILEKWEKARKYKDRWLRTCEVEREEIWPCRILGVDEEGAVYAQSYDVGWESPPSRGWRRVGICLETPLGMARPDIVDRSVIWEGSHEAGTGE